MRKFGQFVNSLNGKYITAEDVGMILKIWNMFVWRPSMLQVFLSMGGSGDPSPVTAYGVYIWNEGFCPIFME